LNDITDKISNWPKNSEIIKSPSSSKILIYPPLAGLLLLILANFIFNQIISDIIHILLIVSCLLLLLFLLYRDYKKHKFNIFKAKAPLIKHTFQLEIDFISWLQNYSIADREFFCERIKAICQKEIRTNNILLGEKATKLGLFSTTFVASATVIARMVTNINNLSLDITFLVCTVVFIVYVVALMDLHVDNKMDYFIELIRKSIALSRSAEERN
jgi:hypothetical protein